MNKHSKTETDSYREQTSGCQRGEGWENEINKWRGVKGINFLLQIIHMDVIYIIEKIIIL